MKDPRPRDRTELPIDPYGVFVDTRIVSYHENEELALGAAKLIKAKNRSAYVSVYHRMTGAHKKVDE
jgi:hypothetical protein